VIDSCIVLVQWAGSHKVKPRKTALQNRSYDGSSHSHASTTLQGSDDVLGRYGGPDVVPKLFNPSPRPNCRDSDTPQQSMCATTASSQSSSSQKGASACIAHIIQAGGSARGTVPNPRANTAKRSHHNDEDVPRSSSRRPPALAPRSRSMVERHTPDMQGTVSPRARSVNGHSMCAPDMPLGGGGVQDESPNDVQRASQRLENYPALLAAALDNMDLLKTGGSSRDENSADLPSLSVRGSSAALLAETHSLSGQANITYTQVQGAAARAVAVKRARSQARGQSPGMPLVQHADNYTWMGSYDHSKVCLVSAAALQSPNKICAFCFDNHLLDVRRLMRPVVSSL
jgi:hypothetical protein